MEPYSTVGHPGHITLITGFVVVWNDTHIISEQIRSGGSTINLHEEIINVWLLII